MKKLKKGGSERLAAAFSKTTGENLERALGKTEIIQMRVSAADKASMAGTSKSLGLTLTDYLTRLHYLAANLLSSKQS